MTLDLNLHLHSAPPATYHYHATPACIAGAEDENACVQVPSVRGVQRRRWQSLNFMLEADRGNNWGQYQGTVQYIKTSSGNLY